MQSVSERENADPELLKHAQKTHFPFIASYSLPKVDFHHLPRSIERLCLIS